MKMLFMTVNVKWQYCLLFHEVKMQSLSALLLASKMSFCFPLLEGLLVSLGHGL